MALSGHSHGSWTLGSTLLPVSNAKKVLCDAGREVLIHYSKQLLNTHVSGPLGLRGEQMQPALRGFPARGDHELAGKGNYRITSIYQWQEVCVLSFCIHNKPVCIRPILQIKKQRLKITQDLNTYLPLLHSPDSSHSARLLCKNTR